MKKRILSSFLSLVLVLSLMPVSALAAEGPQNMAPAVVTAGLHLRVPLYRGDREHGLPHLHGGLYRLYL